jgi:hypothetical protein
VDPKMLLEPQSNLRADYEDFLSSDRFKNYNFEKDDFLRIKIDLNFLDSQDTYTIVEWVKEQIRLYPVAKSLILFLKRYLQINKLNSSFDGNK